MDTLDTSDPPTQEAESQNKDPDTHRTYATMEEDRDSNVSQKSASQDRPNVQTYAGTDEKTEKYEEGVKMMDLVNNGDQKVQQQDGGTTGDVDKKASQDNSIDVEDTNVAQERSDGIPVEIDLKAMSPRVKAPAMPVINQQVDYPSPPVPTDNSQTGSKLPLLTPGKATIARIPSPTPEVKEEVERMMVTRQMSMTRYPPQMMRMAKGTMSQSARVRGSERPISTAQSTNTARSARHYIEPPPSHSPAKVVRWDEAMNARPPLRIDMEGPSPCSYSPHLYRPLKETTAPAFSFGRRTFVEKENMGSRTSWQKTWFQSQDIWRQKTDFFSDRVWPTPMHYEKKQKALGNKQITNLQFPAYSFGYKREASDMTRKSEQPSPGDYDPDKADELIKRKPPAYTHSPRRSTVCWPQGHDRTPGPGAYYPKQSTLHKSEPAFTIRGIRREKTHELGPFATF